MVESRRGLPHSISKVLMRMPTLRSFGEGRTRGEAIDTRTHAIRRGSGYAAERRTHNPTVEEDPMATIKSRSPDFSLAAVRGNCAPKERYRFTARQASAGVPLNCSESAS